MTSPQQGGTNLGNAHGSITMDTSGVRTALQDAKSQINNFVGQTGQQLQRWGGNVSRVGTQMTQMFAPVGAALAFGVKSAASFDETLTEIQARTGLTDEALNQVRESTLELGADTQFSSQQAADSYLQLLTAGLDTEQALATLPAVLDGAAASGEDLGTTADLVTNVMSSFGLEAEQATEIVNAMAQGAGSSPADMRQMGEALQEVGGIAKGFGLDLEQTTGIMSIFAQNGIRGSEAGTQLRSLLREMSSDTPKTAEAWDLVGSSLFDAQGNMRDLDTVMTEISAGMEGLTEEQQNFVKQNLAGSYGRVGFEALLASDGIDAMVNTMRSQTDASEIAEARMDTFQGRLTSLIGSVETLAITALTPFMNNVLKPMVEVLIEVVNGITAWAAANPALVQNIATFLGVMTALGPALFIAGKIISGIGVALTLLSSPLVLAVAAVAALGLAFKTNFMGIRDAAMPIVTWLMGQFMRLSGVVQQVFGAIRSAFQSFRIGLMIDIGVFESLWIAIASFLGQLGFTGPAISKVRSHFVRFRQILEGVATYFSVMWQTFIKPNLDSLFQWFTGTGLPFVQTKLNEFWTLLQTFAGYFGTLWSVISPALTQFSDWFLITALPAIRTFLVDTVFPLIRDFFGFIGDVWTLISPALASMFDWFATTALPGIFSYISDTVYPLILDFFGFIENIWGLVEPALSMFGDWFLNSGLPGIIDFVQGAATAAIDAFIGAVQRMLGVVQGALDAVNNFLTEVRGARESAGNDINAMRDAIADDGARGAVRQGVANIGSFFGAVGGAIRGSFATGTDFVPQTGLYELHRGERVIPADQNRSGMGTNLSIERGAFVISANSYDEGYEAMRGASDAFNDHFLDAMKAAP